jgi:small-conductance mechanosensitive channel
MMSVISTHLTFAENLKIGDILEVMGQESEIVKIELNDTTVALDARTTSPWVPTGEMSVTVPNKMIVATIKYDQN